MHGDQRRLAHAPAGDNPGGGRDSEKHEADADNRPADVEGDQQGADDARDRAKPFQTDYWDYLGNGC